MSDSPTPELDPAHPETWKQPYDGFPPLVSRNGQVAYLTAWTDRRRRKVQGWWVTDGQDEQPTDWTISDDELRQSWRLLTPKVLDALFNKE